MTSHFKKWPSGGSVDSCLVGRDRSERQLLIRRSACQAVQGWTWVGSIHGLARVGLCWMKSTVIFSLHFVFVGYYVLRKFANNASNANAVYRQSTRYSCVTEESWASVGLEFGVQWVGVFTATWQLVNHNQKPDVYFINGLVKIWVLQCWCLHFT